MHFSERFSMRDRILSALRMFCSPARFLVNVAPQLDDSDKKSVQQHLHSCICNAEL